MVTEFVFGVDIEIPFSSLPKNVSCSNEWDLYWSCKAYAPKASDLQTRCCADWLSLFRERDIRSILFVGNGFSQEPHFFAYAGFQVTAMDLSPVATRYAAEMPWSERALLASFGIEEEYKVSFLRGMYRFGGSVRFETGDLFRIGHSGVYDLIITRKTIQLFHGRELEKAILCLKRRLAKKGTLLIEVFEDTDALREIEQALCRCELPYDAPFSSDKQTASLLFTHS